MTINWDNIKFIFQIPLDWFKQVSSKIFNAYGTNFIVVKEGDEGAMHIDVDEDTFAQAVLNVTNGGSGGGTVKSVDGLGPDSNGNVPLGAIRSINEHYYPDANGNVEVGIGVASVDGVMPDEEGNVALGAVTSINGEAPDEDGDFSGVVTSVNGIQPDANGNADISAITSVDGQTGVGGALTLNAVRSVNGKTTNAGRNWNVDVGTVRSLNGITPNAAGQLSISFVQSVNSQEPDANGNVDIPLSGFVKTVDGKTPNSSGAVSFGITANRYVKTNANGHLVAGANPVLKVNNVAPDSTGNVKVDNSDCLQLSDWMNVDSQYSVSPYYYANAAYTGTLPNGVTNLYQWVGAFNYSTLGDAIEAQGVAYEDDLGDLAFSDAITVDGHTSNHNQEVDFGLAGNKYVKTDANGHLTTTNVNPVLSVNGISPASNGNVTIPLSSYVKSVDGKTPNSSGAVSFGITANRYVKTDANGHLVAGTNPVLKVNNVSPNSAGNVTITFDKSDCLLTSDWMNVNSQHSVSPYYYANAAYTGNLPGGVTKLYNWVGAFNYSSLADAVEAQGVAYEDDLGDLAFSDAITVDGHTSNHNQEVDFGLAGNKYVMTDANGHLTTNGSNAVLSVDGRGPDAHGNVLFNIEPNKYVKTDANGHLVAGAMPATKVDGKSADSTGNIVLNAVTLAGQQQITGAKYFNYGLMISADIGRDDTSRPSQVTKALRWMDNNNLQYAFVQAIAYTNGTNEIRIGVNKPSVIDYPPQITMTGTSTGDRVIYVRAKNSYFYNTATASDGRVRVTPEEGRILLMPSTEKTYGGIVDFQYPGASNWTARLIDYASSFYVSVPSGSGKTITLNCEKNKAVLANNPDIARTDTNSKAIATCGWTNTVVTTALNNFNLSPYQKKSDMDKTGNAASYDYLTNNYVTKGTTQTITGSKTFEKQLIVHNDGPNTTWVHQNYVTSNKFSVRNNEQGLQVGVLHVENSTGLGITNDLGAISINADGYLTLDSKPNYVRLTSQPNDISEDSLAVATCGYVQQHTGVKSVQGTEPDESGNINFNLYPDSVVVTNESGQFQTLYSDIQEAYKNVVTDIKWNGTQLVIESETWVIGQGIIMTILPNDTKVINTVTYS